MAAAREWLGKVLMRQQTHKCDNRETMEKVFPMQSVPRLYKEASWTSQSSVHAVFNQY
jgi:hypothetical protein